MLEDGPHSIMSNKIINDIIDELGIADQMIDLTKRGENRYIYDHDEKLKIFPSSPIKFIRSNLLTIPEKLASIKDIFLMTLCTRSSKDPTVSEFIKLHFGTGILNQLVGPFISGIYAGDPTKLSMRAAFPTLWGAEETHGSVIRGFISKALKARKNGSSRKYQLINFKNGLQTLTDALAKNLENEIIFSKSVGEVVERENNCLIQTAKEELIANHVICTSNPSDINFSFFSSKLKINRIFKKIKFSSVNVLKLAIQKNENDADFPHGFGFLTSLKRNDPLLGTIFMSSILPERAPENYHLFSIFIGGARFKDYPLFHSGRILEIINRTKAILKLNGNATVLDIQKASNAIPHYELGHFLIKKRIEQHNNISKINFIGNYIEGIGIPNRVLIAKELAEKLLFFNS